MMALAMAAIRIVRPPIHSRLRPARSISRPCRRDGAAAMRKAATMGAPGGMTIQPPEAAITALMATALTSSSRQLNRSRTASRLAIPSRRRSAAIHGPACAELLAGRPDGLGELAPGRTLLAAVTSAMYGGYTCGGGRGKHKWHRRYQLHSPATTTQKRFPTASN